MGTSRYKTSPNKYNRKLQLMCLLLNQYMLDHLFFSSLISYSLHAVPLSPSWLGSSLFFNFVFYFLNITRFSENRLGALLLKKSGIHFSNYSKIDPVRYYITRTLRLIRQLIQTYICSELFKGGNVQVLKTIFEGKSVSVLLF